MANIFDLEYQLIWVYGCLWLSAVYSIKIKQVGVLRSYWGFFSFYFIIFFYSWFCALMMWVWWQGVCAGVIILLTTGGKSSHLFVFSEDLFFIYVLPPIIFNAGWVYSVIDDCLNFEWLFLVHFHDLILIYDCHVFSVVPDFRWKRSNFSVTSLLSCCLVQLGH